MEMDLLWNVGLTILIAPGTYAIANLFVRMNKAQQEINDFKVEVAAAGQVRTRTKEMDSESHVEKAKLER